MSRLRELDDRLLDYLRARPGARLIALGSALALLLGMFVVAFVTDARAAWFGALLLIFPVLVALTAFRSTTARR